MEPDDVRGPPRAGWRSIAFTLVVTLALCALLAGSASAQNTTQVTIEAREDCPDTTFCFEVTGDLEDVEPGDILDVTLENPEDNLQEHNVHITTREDANVGDEEATPSNRAFANSDDISPGEQTSFSAEIPDNAEAIYLWCTIRAHEQQGMWVEAELAGIEQEEETNGSPGFTGLAALGALAGLALAARRSRGA